MTNPFQFPEDEASLEAMSLREFLRVGSQAAQSGEIRLPNGGTITWRNENNTEDIEAVKVDEDGVLNLQAPVIITEPEETHVSWSDSAFILPNNYKIRWLDAEGVAEGPAIYQDSSNRIWISVSGGGSSGAVILESPDGSTYLQIDNNGITTSLPAADPGVAGRLYHTAGTVMISL